VSSFPLVFDEVSKAETTKTLEGLPGLGVTFLKEVWIAVVLCVVDPPQGTSKRNFSLRCSGGRTVDSRNRRNRLGFLGNTFSAKSITALFCFSLCRETIYKV